MVIYERRDFPSGRERERRLVLGIKCHNVLVYHITYDTQGVLPYVPEVTNDPW